MTDERAEDGTESADGGYLWTISELARRHLIRLTTVSDAARQLGDFNDWQALNSKHIDLAHVEGLSAGSPTNIWKESIGLSYDLIEGCRADFL